MKWIDWLRGIAVFVTLFQPVAHLALVDSRARQQPRQFLQDSGGRLAVQNGTFALVRLEFVVGQFLFPTLVVQHDQVFRRMLPLVEQRRYSSCGPK